MDAHLKQIVRLMKLKWQMKYPKKKSISRLIKIDAISGLYQFQQAKIGAINFKTLNGQKYEHMVI